MDYVHVISSFSKDDRLEKAICNVPENFLYSLIGGLSQRNFALETISKYALKVKKYNESFLNGKMKYADSGGYSIIKGDVFPKDINRFIECYNFFYEYAADYYDYIFSLDIPFSLKHTEMNKKQLIYEFNKEALRQQLEIIEKIPQLTDRLYFVWQFKMRSLYEIWKQIVVELNLNKYIRNRAIGGMVSLRKQTNINYSPFTMMAFKCFHDYLNAGYYNDGFKLHFLGINLPYDRFHIAFLEKLFQRLGYGHEIYHTYDSISYAQRVRKSKNLNIYDLKEDQNLKCYENIEEVPEYLIEKVYSELETIEFIKEEIERRKKGYFLENINSFVALNIYSNLCLDRFFEHIINEYNMVDTLIGANSTAVVEGNFRLINDDLKMRYPVLFGKEMLINIIENMEYTWTYCDWFLNDRSDERLDYHARRLIECIGCDDLLI